MAELASLERTLARVKVANGSEDAADILLLLRAVSDAYRDRTRKPFEGTPTVYEKRVDVGGAADLYLPEVPVTDLLHIADEDWDGTRDAIYVPEPKTTLAGAASWSTALAAAAVIGDTNVKVDDVTDVSVGDHMGLVSEVVRVTTVGTAGAGGSGLTFEPACTFDHALASTAKHVDGSTSWRLVDANRGHIELAGRRRFVVPRWRTAGVIPTYVADDVVEWVAYRWEDRDREAGQTAYSTGDDSETWDPNLAGTPPPSVAQGLLREWHPTRNGVI